MTDENESKQVVDSEWKGMKELLVKAAEDIIGKKER